MSRLTQPGSRNSDPMTSHVAADKAKRFVWDHKEQILGVLFRPMNCYLISQLTGLDHVAVARRMGELRDAGLVRDTGLTDPGPNGRECTLWEKVIDTAALR